MISLSKRKLLTQIFALSHLVGNFKLRSGEVSHEYFDKYLFEGQPKILREVAKQMLPLIPKKIEGLAGLELGGISIAIMLSQLSNIPTLFIRKQPKQYGTCNLIEGGNVANKQLLIVEDIVTSGGQICFSVEDLRKAGAIIQNVICVIDRKAGGVHNLRNHRLVLKSLFTIDYFTD